MKQHQEKYRSFKVLLDEPAIRPALGFDDYAQAFADIILQSRPQFAIGIFGDWGSGKTTLMKAIEASLTGFTSAEAGPPTQTTGPDTSDGFPSRVRGWFSGNQESARSASPLTPAARPTTVIPVWFNAWRYEREPHLIVPLLDTLREGLASWAANSQPGSEEQRTASKAAAIVGRAARALAAGLTLKAAIAPSVDIQFDPNKVMAAWRDTASAANDPLSFYHATFRQMKAAIEDVTRNSERRVVIFIDDLDRCLPLNALEVLESMKLFFDLEGFVFVVGLDQAVIERSIEMKYLAATPAQSGAEALVETVRRAVASDGAQPVLSAVGGPVASSATRRAAPISGADYVKKLFQVPFTLPRINTDDLEPFFESIVEDSGLQAEQQADLRDVVWAHLQAATGNDAGSVNPREVKRLINAYTLQMKLLSAKLDHEPDPHIVIALQTMTFRADWRELYDLLVTEPDVFTMAVRDVRDDATNATDFPLRTEPLPTTFLAYVRGPAAPLLSGVSLDPYVTSAEIVGSTNPTVAEARTLVARLRRMLSLPGGGGMNQKEMLEELHSKLSRLYEKVDRSAADSYYGAEAYRLTNLLQGYAKELPNPDAEAVGTPDWAPRVLELLDDIDKNLREVRRQSVVSASSAS